MFTENRKTEKDKQQSQILHRKLKTKFQEPVQKSRR